jgi:hypothetical protein
MDSTDIDELLLFLLASENLPEPMRTGQSGQEYITELLSSAHPDRVFQVLRMQLSTFNSLRDWLWDNTDLNGDSIYGGIRVRGSAAQVSVEEKLVTFIYIISRSGSNREASERFSRSGKTISRYV